MKLFNNTQKLALLDKANQEGCEIGITGSYTMTGTLNCEELEHGLDPNTLSSPINWDLDEIVDYDSSNMTYDVRDVTTLPLKKNMSEEELFNYLNDLFNLF